MDTHNKQKLPAITMAAIGVVYGDIGTSPLYTFKECFSPHVGLAPTPEVIFGFLSLILWSLILVVSLKYLAFVLRADNRGEGGILTLMSLAGRNTLPNMTTALLVLGLIGGGFFYGEVVITPAMSVLSALEGLQVVTPLFTPYILPIAVVVLTFLFMIQKHGTARVGGFFGPIMLVWFIALGLLGLVSVVQHPEVLSAINPMWGIRFFAAHKWIAFIALGSVVLAITGVEALYADMGHYGKIPIRLAWFSVVLPASEALAFRNCASRFRLFTKRVTWVKPNPSKPIKRVLFELAFECELETEDTLTIETEQHHQYSPSFYQMVQPFYLNL